MSNLVKILRNPVDELPWNSKGWEDEVENKGCLTKREWNQTLLSVISGSASRLQLTKATIYASRQMIVGLLAGLDKYDYMTDTIDGKFKIIAEDYVSSHKIVITSESSAEGIVIQVKL
jgi:hypothetical protein